MRLRLVKDDTHIRFLSASRYGIALSAVMMLASVILFFTAGLNFGIDFQGGTSIRTTSQSPVDVASYREALSGLQLGDVVISAVTDPLNPDRNIAQIRVQQQGEGEALSSAMIETIKASLKQLDPSLTFTSVESVGPKVSGELIRTAMLAVALSVLAVLIYIWLRFEWQFSLGAVAALIHDVLLTIGIFSALQIKFDLAIIAALLTIVGYSLNDTVIVFDRVRENLIKYRKRPLVEILDLSINETLSRTVMTSLTTLLALIALFVFGGDVIRGFVFAMIWGVVVGTYSSVFIAAPLLMRLGVKRDWSKGQEKGPSGTQFS